MFFHGLAPQVSLASGKFKCLRVELKPHNTHISISNQLKATKKETDMQNRALLTKELKSNNQFIYACKNV